MASHLHNESEHLRNEECPECVKFGRDKSGNNLGVYSDGHCWCWSCGYYIPRSGIPLNEIENRITRQKKNKTKYNDLALPTDFTHDLPDGPKRWLTKYGLTEKEKYGFGWSEHHERLIYPVFNSDGSVSFYQGRAFSDSPNKSKYETRGFADDVFHLCGSVSDSVVLTEDIVSAIKVSRHMQAMPLWGSSVSIQRAIRLTHFVRHVKLWLDKDKAAQAIRIKERILPYFGSVQIIISELDPKEYSNESLCQFLSLPS